MIKIYKQKKLTKLRKVVAFAYYFHHQMHVFFPFLSFKKYITKHFHQRNIDKEHEDFVFIC
jgi:hypothetical protein